MDRRARLRSCVTRAAPRLTLVAASSFLALLVMELGVRWLAPQQLILLRPDVWISADRFGWRRAPNLDTVINTGERQVRLVTDGHGHRIEPDTAPRPDQQMILALGDSFAAAIQVDYGDTMCGLLERQLSRELGTRFRVVNAAVGGWGPSHYLLELRDELARGSFRAVLVFVFLGNDVEGVRRDTFPPKEATIRHSLRLPRSPAIGELRDAVAYPVNDYLEVRSHAYILLKNRAWYLLMKSGLSARRFPEVLLKSEADAARWATTGEILRSIHDEAAEKDVPVLFVLLPSVCQVDRSLGAAYAKAVGLDEDDYDPDLPSLLLGCHLAKQGLTWLDALDALRAAHTAGERDLYGVVDTHLGPAGHRIVADLVEPALRQMVLSSEPARADHF